MTSSPTGPTSPESPADNAASSPGEAPTIVSLLRELRELGGSDLHIGSGRVVKARIHGELEPLGEQPLSAQQVRRMLKDICPPEAWAEFSERNDADLAWDSPETGRFRVNLFVERSGPGAILRQIPEKILTLEDLSMPPKIEEIAAYRSGLVLVTGPTGSGKSTTLAAIIDRINRNSALHIITVEDPIEFVHPKQASQITQREVGLHTRSFGAALKSAIREDPDVLLVGEMRDLDTVSLALTAAETGLLVFGTLHTNSATKAIDRVIDMFPAGQQPQARATLAATLKAVIAQVLMRKVGGTGRVAALEILTRNVALVRLIREGDTHMLGGTFRRGNGDQTMDDSVLEAWRSGLVDVDEARAKLRDKKLIPPEEVSPDPSRGAGL